MITVEYKGGLGNILFQYAFGRLLAEELGYALNARPIPGFPGTQDIVAGHDYSDRKEIIVEGHQVDMGELMTQSEPVHIIVRGGVQRSEYFTPYRSKVREWMQPECSEKCTKPQSTDLVLHIRRGDYLREVGYPLPDSYYIQVMEQSQCDRMIIVTDDPKDPFFKKFDRFHPVLVSESQMEDFCFLRHAKHICLSQSTFSWWAAYLSEAQRIFFPQPVTGPFSAERPDIHLDVPEDRYIYVPCKETYRYSFLERLGHVRNAARYRILRMFMYIIPESLRKKFR